MLRMFSKSKEQLTVEQRQMYATEKLVNFRLLAKLLGTRSHQVLTSADLAPLSLHSDLSIFSQFAELAYSVVPIETVFRNFDILSGTGFPLEGYDALKESIFIDAVRGKLADVPAFVAYRWQLKQLVVAFSGTSSFSQALQDMRASKTPYPIARHEHRSSQCSVHTGFWKLYEGIGPMTLDVVGRALEKFTVEEIVLTGHSMGGVLCYLLVLDMIGARQGTVFKLASSTALRIVAFGSPRWANEAMAQYWNDTARAYRAEHGEDSLREYSVKGLNDGESSLDLDGSLIYSSTLNANQVYRRSLRRTWDIGMSVRTLFTSHEDICTEYRRPSASTLSSPSTRMILSTLTTLRKLPPLRLTLHLRQS